jgi:threonine/homoserine/homoserine lactone efflux protein
MDELPPIVASTLTGLISGLLLSIPVGPVNLTIVNEGARRGFRWAVLIGLGATTMEVIYCFVAFTGFASFFTRGYVKAAMEVGSFVFMLFLGIKFLSAKSVQSPVHLSDAADRMESKIEEKLHPHSAFMTGLVRVFANVGVLVFWIILAANFISREWVTPDWPGKLSCVLGVAIGTGSWFIGLSWLVSLGHGRFSEKTLLRMEHFSGIGLLVLATIHGGIIIRDLAKHRIGPGHRHLNEGSQVEPGSRNSQAFNFSRGQFPVLTFRERPKLKIADGNANQPDYFKTKGRDQSADMAIFALVQFDLEPACPGTVPQQGYSPGGQKIGA